MATQTLDDRAPESESSSQQGSEQNDKKPARSLLSRILRFTLWSLLVLVLLLVLILGVFYFLAGTDSGFARVSSIASERVPGLNIVGPGGNLRNGISADSIEFTNSSIDIKASELSTSWNISCLMERQLCLDDVHIERVDISTFASENASAPASRDGPIELPDIALPVDILISTASIGTLLFKAPGDSPAQIIEDIQLSASTEGSVLSLDNFSLVYQSFDARVNGTIELQAEYPLDLELNIKSDDVLPDSVPEGEGKQPILVQTKFRDSLENLVINSRTSGMANLSVRATVEPLQQNLPATLIIESEALGWPVKSKTIVVANSTRFVATGDMRDYEFSLQTSVAGEQVPDTDIDISGSANPRRLSMPVIALNTLGGEASASALATLVQPIQWSTRWKLRDIDPSIQVPDLKGILNGDINASGTVNDGKWSAQLERALITGELRELPFRLDAKVTKEINDLWSIENITLNNDLNQIQAQGFVGEKIELNADINLPQLQNFMPGLAGGFNASINANGDLQSPDVTLQADAEVIRFNDILVQALAINGDVSELFYDSSTLDITVDTVRVGDNTVSDTALSLTGNRAEHLLTFKADGPQGTDVDLSVTGELDESFNWFGLLQSLQATLPGHDARLAEPTAISWQNDSKTVSIAAHCWNISDNSNVCLQNPVRTDASGQATISLDQYSLEQLNELIPGQTRVAGELAANVDLRWGSYGPNDRRAIVTATIDQARIRTVDTLGDPVSFSYDSIALDANVAPDDATADLRLSSQTLGNALVGIQFNPSQPQSLINGSVELNDLQLGIVKAFLPDFDTISGTISAKGQLGGTLSLPEYNGNIVLDSPELRSEILPLPITGGKITARVAGQDMVLNGEILSDDGRIELVGRSRLDAQNWYAEVNLVGSDLTIVSSPLQDSTINHNIQIVANPKRISVTGGIDIPQAVIDVEELPEGAATVSSDIIIVEDEEAEEIIPIVSDSDLNLAVALDVSLGKDVSLSAYGLNANLTGDMDVRIRGNRPPQLGGEIEVVDGIFKKYGQDLEANGQVLFVGPIDSTRLSIDAVREIDSEAVDRVAGLRIQGTVATPEITLFTDPADKSQDAILSYIILGRDINQTSDQEADLLATAALALAVKGGSKVGGGIADALGIKEFGLETKGSGEDAELIVSGRINDRLLLRYGRSVFDAESTLYLRYDLSKKLYLEAAEGAQRAVDLFYSFSF